MTCRHFKFGAALLIALAPVTAWANAGTPLMWVSAFHLIIGNALIGVFEGALLARIFKLPYARAISVMIPANYLSAWCGGLGLAFLASKISVSIYWGKSFIAFAAALSWAATVFLEWPFIALISRDSNFYRRKTFRASLIAQTASYAMLIPWYCLASSTSLYANSSLDRSLSFMTNNQVVLYYLNGPNGDVYCRNLESEDAIKIATVESPIPWDRLCFVRSHDSSHSWDLLVTRRDVSQVVIPKAITDHDFGSRPYPFGPITTNGLKGYFWHTADLRPTTSRDWVAYAGFWPIEGLRFTNTNTEERTYIALDTPFLSWNVRNCIMLPGDVVIFQLGQQICAYDRPTGKLGLITKGRGPAVLLTDN